MYICWAQENIGVPLGALTERSIEKGNKQNKECLKRLSRKNSYTNENSDIFLRRMWESDPIILWELNLNWKLTRGKIRQRKQKRKASFKFSVAEGGAKKPVVISLFHKITTS